jgi:DNA polymerase IIIc chi subunit
LSYPWWFIFICLAVGGVFAAALYFKNRTFTNKLTWLLAILRFLSGSIITFLLLAPILKWMHNETLKPIVVMLRDNSASQNKAFSVVNKNQFESTWQEQVKEIEKFATVKQYSFGAALKDTNKLSYTEGASDLGTALEQISSSYENENLGAVVVASDGIMTQGPNPAMMNLALPCGIFAIGVGDTTIQRDAIVLKTYQNKVAFLGDKFGVKVDVLGLACNGTSAGVSIYHHNSGRVVGNQSVSFTGNKSSKQIELIVDATAKGIQKYSARIATINGETNTTNNSIDFYVEVIDSKQKVLLVCNSPHPDVDAIKEALSTEKNTELVITTADQLKATPSDFNLVILHNLPSTRYNLSSFLDQLKASNAGVLYIVGAQTLLAQYNQRQNALTIKSGTGGTSDILATANGSFNLFTMKPSEASKYSALPPLQAAFGQYSLGPNTSTLFFQKVGAVATTNPLWVLQQSGTNRTGVIAAEGLWRWRMYDFVQHNNTALVDEAIQKTIQYLVVKQDKKPFRAVVSKVINSTNDAISFDAELYNDNFELITPNDVNLVISSNKGERLSYTLNKQEKNYSLNIGTLGAGEYTFEARTQHNGKNFSEQGTFKVVEIDVETANTVADFGMLGQLAKNTEGAFLYPSQTKDLAAMLKEKAKMKNLIRSELNSEPLINWKWIFGLLIALLAGEWFLRKYNGGY